MRLVITLIVVAFLFSCGDNQSAIVVQENDKDSTAVIDSLTYYQEKLNANPENQMVIFERAKYYIRHGEIDLAEADAKALLTKDSTFLKGQKLYADICLAKLDLESSKYHYEYILSRDSLNTGAFIGMGKIFAALDNSAQAIFYLSEALKVNPYLPEPYFTKGLIYRSDYYKRHEDDSKREESWSRAVSSFQTAVEQDPNYYAAYIELGVMHEEVGDSIALEYFNSAIEIFPESIEAWYNKGMYYQNRGEVDNALACYYKLNALDDTWADPYHNIGFIHMMMTEDLDSAVYYFERATQLDPMYYQAYNNLGLAYEMKGDYNSARKYYLKAVDIYPDFQLAKDNLNALN